MKMRRAWASMIAVTVVALAGAGCSPYRTRIIQAQGIELPRRQVFRVNYQIHDPDGKNITDEIMRTDLARWEQFMEMCDRTRAAFEELGYKPVFDNYQPVDFVADVGFSAFYSAKVTEQNIWDQAPATLLCGATHPNGMFTHFVLLRVLAKNPRVTSSDLVNVWEGRGTLTDENPDVRLAGFPILVELLRSFPLAESSQQ